MLLTASRSAGSGCGSVIDLLVSCLADPGDGILVARPYYNGFGASFECRNEVKAVGVQLPIGREADIAAIEAYEITLLESEANGVKIRAIMICNPHNPLGESSEQRS
jgi:1-aminocyclopropane-1-carboxylate synthase